MPRTARIVPAGYPQHIINRAVMRMKIFTHEKDYKLFEDILIESVQETGVQLHAYCIMPNHWHLLVTPLQEGDLSVFMHKLTNAHTRRVHVVTETIGTGPLYQGRYKSFLVEDDRHFFTVLKYIERNAVRAKLVRNTEDWRWGSAWVRIHGTNAQQQILTSPPTPLPHRYLEWINEPEPAESLTKVRSSVTKGVPFGGMEWVEATVT